jgi:Kef-type K+ transport system membrane component KefB/predicted amino acid-binding ACT domain protein
MDAGKVLLDLLIVLAAAKVAGELAERVSLPGVVGEIVAGVVVGPSLLALVPRDDEALRVMGELGVILLLLEVGLQLDLDELREVGRASLAVATVGVVTPFVLGWAVTSALGHGGTTAVFVGAALTATSVGITARVFADLRALVTPEARTVLGAAVADDVMGLVVLTVVVRLATGGSVTVLSVGGVIAVAVAFLVAATAIGIWLSPPLLAAVQRLSRAPGTLLGVVLVVTLGFAQLADAARLAPIVGAFVAGLVLARSDHAERVRREVAPVGHVFVPVFFLMIGVDADVGAFAKPAVLALAGALLAAAVIGKLVAAVGARGVPGDKVVIGLGMLPRGEVGLIFATLGLREGVLSENLYAALLLVVLATTLVAPPLLRRRMTPASRGTTDDAGEAVLATALRASLAAAHDRPEAATLDWFGALAPGPLRFDSESTRLFVELLRSGTARSWRLLAGSGVLDRALPELATRLARRRDPFDLDPFDLVLVDAVRDAPDARDDARALLAAVVLDAADGDGAVPLAHRVLSRLDVDARTESDVAALVADDGLLRVAARRPDALDESRVVQLAAHVERPDRLQLLHALAIAEGELDATELRRLDQLVELVRAAQHDPHGYDRPLVERRRLEAAHLAPGDREVAERLEHAPWAYLVALSPADLVRQARLLEPVPVRRRVRVAVTSAAGAPVGTWRVDVAGRDRPGLLAVVTGVLRDVGVDVRDATIATWPDGGALESFVVTSVARPDPARIAAAVERADVKVLESAPLPDAAVAFDDGSPWHTRVHVRARDHGGLLHELAVALWAAGCDVHAASVETHGDDAIDRFEVTDRRGRKLDGAVRAIVDATIRAGAQGRRDRTLTRRKHKGNGRETSPPYGRPSTPEAKPRRHVCEGQQSDSPV